MSAVAVVTTISAVTPRTVAIAEAALVLGPRNRPLDRGDIVRITAELHLTGKRIGHHFRRRSLRIACRIAANRRSGVTLRFGTRSTHLLWRARAIRTTSSLFIDWRVRIAHLWSTGVDRVCLRLPRAAGVFSTRSSTWRTAARRSRGFRLGRRLVIGFFAHNETASG